MATQQHMKMYEEKAASTDTPCMKHHFRKVMQNVLHTMSCVSLAAPYSSNRLAISIFPFQAAKCNGVLLYCIKNNIFCMLMLGDHKTQIVLKNSLIPDLGYHLSSQEAPRKGGPTSKGVPHDLLSFRQYPLMFMSKLSSIESKHCKSSANFQEQVQFSTGRQWLLNCSSNKCTPECGDTLRHASLTLCICHCTRNDVFGCQGPCAN